MFTVKNEKPKWGEADSLASSNDQSVAFKPNAPADSAPSSFDTFRTDSRVPTPATVDAPEGGLVSIIGEDLSVQGSVLSKGRIKIFGTVEGDVKALHVLVERTGKVNGQIAGDTAEVFGQVRGSVRAATALLRTGAHVEGDVFHEVLVIEQGALFDGSAIRTSVEKQTK